MNSSENLGRNLPPRTKDCWEKEKIENVTVKRRKKTSDFEYVKPVSFEIDILLRWASDIPVCYSLRKFFSRSLESQNIMTIVSGKQEVIVGVYISHIDQYIYRRHVQFHQVQRDVSFGSRN